jgi:hypothetical protein
MQQPDFIEELFQRHEHKLNERPPAELWDRLEQRLDQRKQKPRFLWSKIFAAASISLVLAASSAVFYALGKKQEAQELAQGTTAGDPLSDQRPKAAQEPLAEPLAGANGEAPPPPPKVIVGESPGYGTERDNLPVEFPAPPVPSEAEERVYEDHVAEKTVFTDAETVSAGTTDMSTAPRPEVASAPRPMAAPRDNGTAGAAAINPALAPFAWMLGTWRDTRYEGTSVEVWKQKNASVFEGMGTLLLDGDTLLNERLTLLEDKGEVYFLVSLDQVNRRAKFRLEKITGSRFVFEHLDPAMPCTVVLEVNPDGTFSTEIRKTGKNNRYSIDQANYLSKRNYLDQSTARRVLSR